MSSLARKHRVTAARLAAIIWMDRRVSIHIIAAKRPKVHNWLTANKLTLNTTKTEFMLIGSRQRLSTLTNFPRPEINGAPIDQVANAKSLGVIIDDNLNWSSHIDKLTKKIASGIGAIKRVRHLVPQVTLQTSLALLYNRILIIVMLFGETAVSHSNKNCKSYKIEQHAF